MRYQDRHNEIVDVCKTAATFTEIEIRLGSTSPNTKLRNYIKSNNISLPFYEGQRAGCRKSQETRDKIDFKDLTTNSNRGRGSIKNFLFRQSIKKQECQKCGWKEKRDDGLIPLHLHHINGNGSDNRVENLEILCPNCHSLTNNYAGKNQNNPRRSEEHLKRKAYYSSPTYVCKICNKLGYGEKYCSSECQHRANRKTEWPTKVQLEQDINDLSWLAIGRKYGVSDNAIRKWAKHYDIAF